MTDQNPKLTAALKAAAQGIPVFRLRSNGKKPAGKGWQREATTDPATITRLWTDTPDANIGWATGGGLFALDVDVKKDRQGDQSLRTLQLDHGFLPKTLVNATPTGGWHELFKTDRPIINHGTGKKLGQGIDVRGEGGYVVGAGSTIDGKPYTSEFRAIADAPRWLIDMTDRPIERQHDQPVAELDTAAAIARAIEYLQGQAPEAVEGEGGDHTTFTVAARLRDLAISEPQALELMLEHWNPLCSPPWDPEDLERKVANAFQYASRAPGNASAEADFQTEQPQAEWPTPVEEFNPADLKPYDWLIGTMLARGHLTLLVAPPGAGKTKFTLAAALAGATGNGDTIGMKVAKPLRVWAINVEDSLDDLRRNTAAAKQLAGIEWRDVKDEDGHSRLFLNSGQDRRIRICGLNQQKQIRPIDQPWLIERCKAERIDVLIIDPIVNTHTLNENDNGQMAEFADLLRRIAQEADCAVLAVHHTRKRDSKAPQQMAGDAETARGAQALIGAARIVKTLYQPSEKDRKDYGLTEDDALQYARLDDAKSNIARRGREAWFKLESVLLGGLDGFEVGAIKRVEMTKVIGEQTPQDLARDLLGVMVAEDGGSIGVASAVRRLAGAIPFSYGGMDERSIRQRIKRELAKPGILIDGRWVQYVSNGAGASACVVVVPDTVRHAEINEG